MGALVEKVCPVVLRHRADNLEILCFRHPLAGMQVVKGTLEVGETPEQGAARELFEESGLRISGEMRVLGTSNAIAENQVWHFVLCPVTDHRDAWTFKTDDDGGHLFAFEWTSLDRPKDAKDWHPIFLKALEAITSWV